MFNILPLASRLLPFLACLLVLFAPLPACQVVKQNADSSQNYMLDIAKAITKTNLQKLFPDAHFERDSIAVEKPFSKDFLRQVFHEKVRHFLTPVGHIEASTQDFYAKISWEKQPLNPIGGEFVKISLVYYKKKKRTNLQVP
jgi:hypothetical protein